MFVHGKASSLPIFIKKEFPGNEHARNMWQVPSRPSASCTRRGHSRSAFRERHSARSPPKSSAEHPGSALAVVHGQCIVSLLASHISSPRRLQYLQQCLRSIAAQTDAPAALYLSWYADDVLAPAVKSAFESVGLGSMRFVPLQQSARLSQYEHLRRALERAQAEMPAGQAASTWLSFSDDDDLWHPRRIELIRHACVQHPDAQALAFGIYAHPVDDACREAATAQDVDKALDRRQGGLFLCASEIFQFAVRPHVLQAFFTAEPASVIRHKFADVRFSQYLRHQMGQRKGSYVSLGKDELAALDSGGRGGLDADGWLVRNWFYFYRQTRHQGRRARRNPIHALTTALRSSGGADESPYRA